MKYCEIIADNISKAGSYSELGRQIHEDLHEAVIRVHVTRQFQTHCYV